MNADVPEADANRELDRRRRVGRRREIDLARPEETRLRHEARRRAVMTVSRMHEERVTQKDVARLAGCVRELALVHVRQPGVDSREVHPLLAGRCKRRRHVEVRADADARWRVVAADVREEKQHQQSAHLRTHVDPVRAVALEAAVDVPAVVARIAVHGEPHRRCPAQAVLRLPAARPDKLVDAASRRGVCVAA